LIDLLQDKKEQWNLSSSEQKQQYLEIIAIDKANNKVCSDHLLLFPYAKGILCDEGRITRTDKFKRLLDHPALVNSKQRLIRIVESKEDGKDFKIGSDTLFSAFTKDHNEWTSGFVLFRDHPALFKKPHVYVERIQLNDGLCYMHAPVVLQHYLVAMNSSNPIPMLDMSEYMRQYLPTNALERYIWKYEGGDSREFLLEILHSANETRFISCSGELDLPHYLHLYGPGLIQGFKVDETFNSNIWQHLGDTRIINFQGRHAMVLVGYRMEHGQPRYLIQNWWMKKPFVEVDAEYLVSCGAVIHFVKTTQTQMSQQFTTNMHDHVECELDAPENFAPEMTTNL
jgi:hypothetical protein